LDHPAHGTRHARRSPGPGRQPAVRPGALGALAAAGLALLGGCGGEQGTPTGPPPTGSGTVAIRLVSPNGPEGAALLEVDAAPVRSVTPDDDVVLSKAAGDRMRIVLVRATAGELRARLTLAETSAELHATVVQVADSLDALRPDLSGYRVEVGP